MAISYLDQFLRTLPSLESRLTYKRELGPFFKVVTDRMDEEGMTLAESDVARAIAQLPLSFLSTVITEWDMGMETRGLAPATRRQRVGILKSFYKYAFKARLRENNPADLITTPTVHFELQHRPNHTEDDMAQLLRVVKLERNIVQRYRDLTMIGFMWASGLRNTETRMVKRGDLTPLPDGTMKLKLVGKGGVPGSVVIPKAVVGELLEYLKLDRRPFEDASRCHKGDYVFLAVNDKRNPRRPLARNTVTEMVREYCQAAGITSAGTHSLRRTFATIALNVRKIDARLVQKTLRHKSLDTTLRYDCTYSAGVTLDLER